MVHAGFLRSYTTNGFRTRVLASLGRAIRAARGGDIHRGVRVLVTGHSLGGALAMLCALDVARKWHGVDLSCYTFGAPRVGNPIFAWLYSTLVPDTWHVVNNDVMSFGSGIWFVVAVVSRGRSGWEEICVV